MTSARRRAPRCRATKWPSDELAPPAAARRGTAGRHPAHASGAVSESDCPDLAPAAARHVALCGTPASRDAGRWRRWLHGLCALVLVAALAGCGTVREARFDPSLLPSAAARQAPFPGRVDLLTDPQSLGFTVTGERLYDLPADRVRMPIGRIVHEAALAAFAQAFEGGARAVDRLDATPGRAPVAIVALRVDQYAYRHRLLYFVPLGPLSVERSQLDLQLARELRLLDADGVVLWAQRYDSGLKIWAPRRGKFGDPPEPAFDGLVRLTHEVATRLAHQAARDVGEWLRNERLRERAL